MGTLRLSMGASAEGPWWSQQSQGGQRSLTPHLVLIPLHRALEEVTSG